MLAKKAPPLVSYADSALEDERSLLRSSIHLWSLSSHHMSTIHSEKASVFDELAIVTRKDLHHQCFVQEAVNPTTAISCHPQDQRIMRKIARE
jgi:hypothetical protein